MNYQLIFGIISGIFTLVFFAVYLHSILKGETKPHLYTALLYALMTGLILSSQITNQAGIGATYLGITFFFWCIIFLMSFKLGIKNIVFADKLSLVFALIAIPVWYFSGNPLLSVILLMIVDLFSSIPTVRKTYVDPYSENSYVYLIEFVGIFFSILALTQIDFINAGYLLYIMLFDLLMFFIVFYRRKIVK
ncbi:hypothetical protein N9J72_00230 [Candidatus Gracilibacteria bacterium]|nr:hypothetical protein [Candidatus Gracilibacteria bacterium]